MDSHLKLIPGLATLTVRGLTGGDAKSLGRKSDGALDEKVLRASTVNELLADLLQGSGLARGQGDTDLVSFLEAQVLADLRCFASVSR